MPEFGKMHLNDLDYARIKRWVIRKSATYSKDSVRLMIAVLRSMLQEAVNEGILQTNPVVKLGKFYRKARKLKSKIDPFTLEELHQVEEKCRERFPEYYGFILCMARKDMRIGEVTGLLWQDVDFRNNYIVVQRNIPHHRQVETTKTAASQRKMDMSPELDAELIRLRTERKKQSLADGIPFDAEEWIFRNERGMPVHYTNFMRRAGTRFRILQKSGGAPLTSHSWASHMLAAGADLAYVASQLKHSNPSITLRIYSHWVPGTRRVTTSILDSESASNLQTLEKMGDEKTGERP